MLCFKYPGHPLREALSAPYSRRGKREPRLTLGNSYPSPYLGTQVSSSPNFPVIRSHLQKGLVTRIA